MLTAIDPSIRNNSLFGSNHRQISRPPPTSTKLHAWDYTIDDDDDDDDERQRAEPCDHFDGRMERLRCLYGGVGVNVIKISCVRLAYSINYRKDKDRPF